MKINKILAVGLVGALALSVGGVCQPLDKALAQTSKEDRSALLPPQNQAAPTSPEDLEKEKTEAKNQLKKLKNLSGKEKKGYISRIENASSINEIKTIITEAQTKDNAKKQLKKLKNLSTKEKGEYKSRIEGASSKEAIDEIIREAQTKDAEILKTAKEKSIKEIENDKDLDSNERGILLDKIQKAETISGIKSIKDFSLPIAKELSKATNLSKDQKDSLREYNGKHSEDHYKKIQKLNEKVGQAKKEIQDLKNIDENKKQDYKNQIDKKIEEDEIDEIVQKAKAEKGKEDGLAKEKEKAKAKIEEDYNKKVAEIEEAKNSTKEEKEEAKTKAKEEADKAKGEIEKAETNAKVTEAKTAGEEEINKIKPKEDIKPAAKAKIEESNLSEKNKEKYLKQIQNAKTQKEIEKILKKALKEQQKADKKINISKTAKQNPAKLASTGLSTQSSTFIATILAMIAIFLRRRNK